MACCGANNKPFDIPIERKIKSKKKKEEKKKEKQESTVIKIDNGEGPIIVQTYTSTEMKDENPFGEILEKKKTIQHKDKDCIIF